MIKCAIDVYGYQNDDILVDAVSSFAVIACAIGEALGSLQAGFLSDILGIKLCCEIDAAITITFSIVFLLGTGLANERYEKIKTKLSIEAN